MHRFSQRMFLSYKGSVSFFIRRTSVPQNDLPPSFSRHRHCDAFFSIEKLRRLVMMHLRDFVAVSYAEYRGEGNVMGEGACFFAAKRMNCRTSVRRMEVEMFFVMEMTESRGQNGRQVVSAGRRFSHKKHCSGQPDGAAGIKSVVGRMPQCNSPTASARRRCFHGCRDRTPK